MNELINQGLSYISNILSVAFVSVSNFLMSFLPNSNTDITNTIHIAFNVIEAWVQNHYVFTPLNLYFFFNMKVIYTCLTIAISMICLTVLVKVVLLVVSIVHKLLDSIPVIG